MTPLWAKTAQEHASYAALAEEATVDVAVIGGGILGLSTALALARAGRRVAVLEAAAIGHGASGRNGGLVVPSLPRVGPDDVLRIMGAERGSRFIRAVLGAPAEVAGLIQRYGIACGFEQSGWLNPAHGPTMVDGLERRLATWKRFGSPATLLSAAETRARIGSGSFYGAIADPTGGHLNPLAMAIIAAAPTATTTPTAMPTPMSSSPAWSMDRTRCGGLCATNCARGRTTSR